MRWDTRRSIAALALALLVAGAACDTGDGRTLEPPTEPAPTTSAPVDASRPEVPVEPIAPQGGLSVVAPWADGAPIPARYTCDGDDVSPELRWSGVPDGTAEIAVVVTDDDAGGFVHWAVTGIDPSTSSIAEGTTPFAAVVLRNSFSNAGWNGPCPPAGTPHTYRFVLHALNQPLQVADETPTSDAVALIQGAAIASATVTGTYTR